MVARFQERAEWCSCLKTSGSRVCNLVLGLTDDQDHLVARLLEVVGQLQVMQDEHQALQNSATQVWDMVLERFGEASSKAVLFSTGI
jgi:hypothetical protein